VNPKRKMPCSCPSGQPPDARYTQLSQRLECVFRAACARCAMRCGALTVFRDVA
jgi:hypothetical protein